MVCITLHFKHYTTSNIKEHIASENPIDLQTSIALFSQKCVVARSNWTKDLVVGSIIDLPKHVVVTFHAKLA